MGRVEVDGADERPESAYPETTPPDPLYPCQTREPLAPLLDGVATPAMWSRLAAPLSRALEELWRALGLLDRHRPGRWVSIQYGCVALNAHGFERLRARMTGVDPDPELVARGAGALQALPDHFERLRALWLARRLPRFLQEAHREAERSLRRAYALDARELDAAELARGPLDDRAWSWALLPWLAAGAAATPGTPPPAGAEVPVRQAIALELRFGSELGRRLAHRGTLSKPAEVAYLTVAERIAAVHDESSYWTKLVRERERRVECFAALQVPRRFWGRPRVGPGPAADEEKRR